MAASNRSDKLKIDLPLDALADFCRRWKIIELALFGSALRDDFGPDSDIDLLFTLSPDARLSLWDLPDAERELSELIGGKVEFVSRRGIEQSRNWIRKNEILGTARIVYAA